MSYAACSAPVMPPCTYPIQADGLCHGHWVQRDRGVSPLRPLAQQVSLSSEERELARARHAAGESMNKLARSFGVGRRTMQLLIRGREGK